MSHQCAAAAPKCQGLAAPSPSRTTSGTPRPLSLPFPSTKLLLRPCMITSTTRGQGPSTCCIVSHWIRWVIKKGLRHPVYCATNNDVVRVVRALSSESDLVTHSTRFSVQTQPSVVHVCATSSTHDAIATNSPLVSPHPLPSSLTLIPLLVRRLQVPARLKQCWPTSLLLPGGLHKFASPSNLPL